MDSRAAVHGAPIAGVAYSPDKVLYTVGYDGDLCEYREDRPEASRRLHLHDKGINCVAADPTGQCLVTGGSDGSAWLVFRRTWRQVRLDHPGDVECATFSPAGDFVVTGGTNGEARIWRTADGKLVAALPHGMTVGACAVHEGQLVTGCNDRVLRVFSWEGRELASAVVAEGPVKALVATRYGVLAASHDCTVRHVLPHVGESEILYRAPTTIKSMAALAGGERVVLGGYDQTLTVLCANPRGGRADRIASVRAPRAWFHAVAACGDRVAAGSFDGVPALFDVDGDTPRIVPRERRRVPCISAMARSQELGVPMVAGDSGDVRVLTGAADDEAVLASVEGAVTGLASIGEDLVVATWAGDLLRLRGGRRVWTARWARSGYATCPVLKIDADAHHVIAGLYTGGAACFDARTGEHLWTQAEARGAVKYVALAAPYYAMTGRYDPLRLGRVSDGAVLARLPLDVTVSDVVAFSPFGARGALARLAVCAHASEVWIVDVVGDPASPGLEVVHRGVGHALPVKAFAWADERQVIAGDYAGRLIQHRIGEPSTPLHSVPCRLGISALSASGGRLFWTTFDGHVGAIELAA